jgi:hypothetical protein
MRPDELDELLGAYALDAVEPDERDAIEHYMATNPRARAEVEQHREVATMLAITGAPAPEGLWDRITSAIEGEPPTPGPQLAQVLPPAEMPPRPTPAPPAESPNEPPRSVMPGRRATPRRRRWLVGVAGAAAAIVIAVLSVAVVHRGNELDRLRGGVGSALEHGYDQALADPRSHTVQLQSSDGLLHAQAVVEPGGQGFLSGQALPALPDGRVYQLWGVLDGDKVVSLGVMGSNPGVSAFSVDPSQLRALAITEEEPGGVAVTKNQPTLQGTLS